MKITGIVLKIENKTAFIYTNKGEFRKVKIASKVPPSIGEQFTGKSQDIHLIKGQVHPLRNFLFILLLILSISLICFTYMYFSPASKIIVDTGPSFELNCNKWNAVINSSSVDNKGTLILSNINIKKKSVNEALINITKQCKAKHFLKQDKPILIYVHGNDIDLSQFKKFVNNNSIKIIINSNGKN